MANKSLCEEVFLALVAYRSKNIECLRNTLFWASITKSLRLSGLKNKKEILTILEGGKSKMKVPADSASGESSLPGLQTATFLLYLHRSGWGRGGTSFLVSLLISTLIVWIRAPFL